MKCFFSLFVRRRGDGINSNKISHLKLQLSDKLGVSVYEGLMPKLLQSGFDSLLGNKHKLLNNGKKENYNMMGGKYLLDAHVMASFQATSLSLKDLVDPPITFTLTIPFTTHSNRKLSPTMVIRCPKHGCQLICVLNFLQNIVIAIHAL